MKYKLNKILIIIGFKMENKIVYENDEKKLEVMPKNNTSSFKNSIIEGSGSESSLKTIGSQPKDINISSISSLNPVAKSNNSFNISNESKNIIKNEQSSSFNSINEQYNNINHKDELKISEINREEITGSKAEISSLVNMLNNGKEDNKINNVLDSVISSSFNNENMLKTIFSDNDNKNLPDINNEEKKQKKSDDNKEYINQIKQKIKEGYIPFFIQAKGYNPKFYYGDSNSKFRTVIENYNQNVNGSFTINNLFYYNNKLIDLDSTIGELNIKPLSLISDEIK